jgi:hypothetical protein
MSKNKCTIPHEEVVRMYNEGVNMKDLSEKVGVSRQSVWGIIKKYQDADRRDGSKGEMIPMICPQCNTPFTRPYRNTIMNDKENSFCTVQCFHTFRSISGNGSEDNTTRKRYGRRSRLLYERMVRPLTEGEVLHHIDGDITNVTLENFMIFPNQSAHMKFHHTL